MLVPSIIVGLVHYDLTIFDRVHRAYRLAPCDAYAILHECSRGNELDDDLVICGQHGGNAILDVWGPSMELTVQVCFL